MILRFLKVVVLVAASSTLTLLLAEGALHLFPSLLPIKVRQVFGNRGLAHPEIGNLPVPLTADVIVTKDFESPYQLDENGFRNNASWPERADIIAIGDSLVFGYGVDVQSAWPQIVAARTGQRVLNLGLIGASPQQYQKVYEIFARPKKPKLLVVGFFGRNDFWDAERYSNWKRSGYGGNYLEWRDFGRPTAEELGDPFYRTIFFIRKNSYVAALTKLSHRVLFPKETDDPQVVSTIDGSPMWLYQHDFSSKTRLSGDDNVVFDKVVERIRKINKSCLVDGTRIVVLLQPGKEEVYQLADDQEYLDSTVAFRKSLEELGIDYIDASLAFRKQAKLGKILFFPTDGHPNAEGYRLLADLVSNYVTQQHEDT